MIRLILNNVDKLECAFSAPNDTCLITIIKFTKKIGGHLTTMTRLKLTKAISI